MGIEAKNRTIDGVTYTVATFPARRGLAIKSTLVKSLGPALSELMKAVPGGTSPTKLLQADLKLEHVAGSLGKLFECLDEKQFVELVMRLLEDTMRDGVPISGETFDVDFAGDYSHLYKVLWFVLEVNFGSFFARGGLGSIISRSRILQPSGTAKSQPSQAGST